MSSALCITLRFLDAVPRFHGRGSDGDPEWPPSPLRVFQALVCAAATRWRDRQFQEYARPTLEWLEAIRPSIVAPPVPPESYGYRMYVPNNSGDLMTAAWARGDTETSMAKFRVEKDVRPTHLLGGNAVHYVYPLAGGNCPQFDVIQAAARSVTHLGWGVDMVAGNAAVVSEEEAAKLPGERWLPADGAASNGLRVPGCGTLNDLLSKHAAFLNRLPKGGFKPVPPLSAFRVVGYRRATEPAGRPWAAFRIASVDPDDPNPAFDPPRYSAIVAAWVRSATGDVCREWADAATFVHGHDPDDTTRQATGEHADTRFMYLPLPTINHKLTRVESIRRVLLAVPPGFGGRINWVRRRLPGQELVDLNGQVRGMLTDLSASDWVLRQYTATAAVWSTVTPVLLPGYDDPDRLRQRIDDNRSAAEKVNLLERLAGRVEELLRKALRHAGYPDELVGRAELEWRKIGFRPGTEPADRYVVPERLKKFPAYHVRVRWRSPGGRPVPVAGPVCVGAGRYCGIGLFAAEEDGRPAAR